jgi:hypothetical protein
MALVVADRVKETTTSTGTGAISLAGAEPNFRTFASVLSDADTTYYAIIDDNNLAFEVGLGTYASSGNTITRTTVLASSNSNNAVNFSAGTKDVFLTYPADKSVNRDASGNVSVSGGVTATQVDLTGQGDLRLQDASGGQYVALQAPATVGSSFTFTLPSADGSADQLLKTDGSGNLSFTTVNASPSFTATADGSLADGDPVVLTPEGKVKKPVVAAEANGSETNFSVGYGGSTADTDNIALVYDTTNNKVVVLYDDGSNSSTLNAKVGTISGTSISWGSNVIAYSSSMASGDRNFHAAFDEAAGKIVVAFASSSEGLVIVGTVSGTSTSWGSTATFNAGSTEEIGVAYSPQQQKCIVLFKDNTNSTYGTAVPITISGTTPTAGTKVVYNSAWTGYSRAAFDHNSGQFVVAYQNGSGGSGAIRGGKLDGTTITFSDQFQGMKDKTRGTVGNARYISIAYAPDTGLFCVASQGESDNDGYASIFRLTKDDSDIAMPSYANNEYGIEFENTDTTYVEVVYHQAAHQFVVFSSRNNTQLGIRPLVVYPNTANDVDNSYPTGADGSFVASTLKLLVSYSVEHLGACYDPDTQQLIVGWANNSGGGNDGKGYGAVYNPKRTDVSGQNFVGFSNGAYSDGDTATIQISGAVDDAQSGLFPGATYYVQDDGTLSATNGNANHVDGSSTTASFPSQKVGIALSATQIKIA